MAVGLRNTARYFGVVLVLFSLLHGQVIMPAMASSFSLIYGEDGFDFLSDVKVLRNGGFVAVGHTNSKGAGNYDGWVVKTNASGQILSERVLGTSQIDILKAVHELPDSGFLVAGYKQAKSNGEHDVWLVRLNRDLTVAWQKTIGGPSIDRIRALEVLPDGQAILVGTMQSADYKSSKGWFFKVSANGTVVWENKFEIDTFTKARSFYRLKDGRFVVIASGSKENYSDAEHWLYYTTAAGVIQNKKKLFDVSNRNINGILQLEEGDLLLSGSVNNRNTADYDVELTKTTVDGQILWQKTYGGDGRDTFSDITELANHTFVVAADTESKGSGGSDFWFFKVDSDGKQLWDVAMGNAGYDGVISLVALPQGGIAAVGWTENQSKDAILLTMAPQHMQSKKIPEASAGSENVVSKDLEKHKRNCRQATDKKQNKAACTMWIRANLNASEAYFNRAVAHKNDLKSTYAIADLSDAVKLRPDYAEALVLRGNILNGESRVDQAEVDFRQAIHVRPRSSFAYDALGALLLRKRTKEANEEVLNISSAGLAAFPTNPEIQVNRCVALERLNRQNDALKACSSAIELGGSTTGALRIRGRIFQKNNLNRKALADYSIFIEARPDDEYALADRAEIYVRLGDYDNALIDYNKLVELQRKKLKLGKFMNKYYAQALVKRGKFLLNIGNTSQAKSDFTEASKLGNSDAKAELDRL